ncbi:prepilin-type N-terminal cleavage/methylation domain-containing protein [Rhodanobacter sp. DHB23]|nr:prepilin-type N-terminal cleavage/methylation domain-containing protein [Rhodanobacter sp. DHB23]
MASAQAGFTLIELLVVVAIIAVLAAIALPSYKNYVVKTNRAAAEGCLSEYSNYMERFYTTNLSYSYSPASGATVATQNPVTTSPASVTLDCATASQTGSNYTYTVPSSSSAAYTLQAMPTGAQLTRDTQCGALTLDQAGNRNIGANGTTATGTVEQCWGG